MTRKEFADKVNKLMPENTQVLRSLTIAQAIIESSDSRGNVANSSLTKKGNALFGIKCGKYWTGKRMNCNTFEVYDGKRVDIVDAFRAYDSWQDSIIDHEKFLQLNHYRAVRGEKDYKKACHAIHKAGYATAPNYAATLINIIETHKLYEYDKALAQQDAWYIFVGHFLPTETAQVCDNIVKLQSKNLYSESRTATDKRLWLWCGKFETMAKAKAAVGTIKGLLGQNTYCEIRKVK